YTDYDFPRPPRIRSRYKIHGARDHLALRYEASAGTCRWENRRDGHGALVPFAWDVALAGVDQHGARMGLQLTIDATRPPAPPGGKILRGGVMVLGAPGTYSYFPKGLVVPGRLRVG